METLLGKLVVASIGVGALFSGLLNNNLKLIEPPTIQYEIEPEIIQKENWADKGEFKYAPTHRQVIYRSVLEWCESRGDNSALNPKDKDNTPSYSNYQFKWQTLRYYADRYKLLPNDLEKEDYINWAYDYELTTEIANRMIGERDKINWKKEFPDCVKRYGVPPKQL